MQGLHHQTQKFLISSKSTLKIQEVLFTKRNFAGFQKNVINICLHQLLFVIQILFFKILVYQQWIDTKQNDFEKKFFYNN